MIRQYGDPILEETCVDFDLDNPPVDPLELREEMFRIMKENGGVGLAANQIGYNFRAIALLNMSTNNPVDMKMLALNPEIIETSDVEVDMFETCLSFSDVKNVQISRPHKVKARWINAHGKLREEWLDGYTARIFQHELDHLNGVTMKDHVTPAKWKQFENA